MLVMERLDLVADPVNQDARPKAGVAGSAVAAGVAFCYATISLAKRLISLSSSSESTVKVRVRSSRTVSRRYQEPGLPHQSE